MRVHACMVCEQKAKPEQRRSPPHLSKVREKQRVDEPSRHRHASAALAPGMRLEMDLLGPALVTRRL
jgi:hypothetical protein